MPQPSKPTVPTKLATLRETAREDSKAEVVETPKKVAATSKSGRKITGIPGGGTGKNSVWLHRTTTGKILPTEKLATPKPDESEIVFLANRGIIGADAVGVAAQSAALREQAEETLGATGTSIFDPVLAEISYRWYCPPNGRILDPFAGGSVRGIVAAKLGYSYVGVDLSGRQLEANREQAASIIPDSQNHPIWIEGDSRDIRSLVENGTEEGLGEGESNGFDMVISCPPYFDLELYSEDERDISAMSWEGFLEVYGTIIRETVGLLADNRFIVWVVGDCRDRKTGLFRGLPWETVRLFAAAGCGLYNDAVLLTAIASLPIRVAGQFKGRRKLGKAHQNVLTFVKGDPLLAAAAVGEVDAGGPEEWGIPSPEEKVDDNNNLGEDMNSGEDATAAYNEAVLAEEGGDEAEDGNE